MIKKIKKKKHTKGQLFLGEVIVKKSPTHGYGVFAGKTFRKKEMIEECYIIVTRGGDKVFEDYYFDVKRKYGVFLGYGSIYNHSDDPNADYTINRTKRIATIRADRTIHKGEEIFVSYGDKWFSSRGWETTQTKLEKKTKETKKKKKKRK